MDTKETFEIPNSGSNSVLAELQLSIDMRHEMADILADVKTDLASVSAWKRQGFELSHEEYLERAKNDHFYKSKEGKASRRMEEQKLKKAVAAAAKEAAAPKEPVNPFDKPTSSTKVKVPLNLKSKINGLSSNAENISNVNTGMRPSVPVTIPMSPTRAQVSSVAAKSRGAQR